MDLSLANHNQRILLSQNYLKENLILEKHISFNNLTLEKYNTYWSPWNSFWLFFTKSTQVTILYFYFVKKSVCSQYSMDNSILKPAKLCVFCHEKNPQPLMPFNIGLFLKSRKGSKDMYNVLNRKTVQISAERKWENMK
jgi:hypothetical protein